MTAANAPPPGGKIKPRRAVLARAEAAPVLALDGAFRNERCFVHAAPNARDAARTSRAAARSAVMQR